MRWVAISMLGVSLAACAPAEDPADTPHWRARFYCNEALPPGRPSACLPRPVVATPDPRGCAAFAAARAEAIPRRQAYEVLCRDGVIDPDGRSTLDRARLADRIEIVERVAENGLADPGRRARAIEERALLRALFERASLE